MKSDKEFLDGIYEKAAQYDLSVHNEKREDKKTVFKWQSIASVAAALLIGFLGLGLIVSNKKATVIEPGTEHPIVETRGVAPIEFSLYEDEGDYAILEEANNADAVVSGRITRNFIDNNDLYSEMKIENCYMGSIDTEHILIHNAIRGEDEFCFSEEEQVLLFIILNQEYGYQLTDPYNGKLSYDMDEAGEAVYIRYDGMSIYERNLNSELFMK